MNWMHRLYVNKYYVFIPFLYSFQYEGFKHIDKYLFYNENINNLKKLLNNVYWISYLKICNKIILYNE